MNQLHISDQGLALLRDREGCILKPYQDSVGVWTDGVGNTHGVVPNGQPISQAQADADLRNNLRWAEGAVNGAVAAPLEQHQFDALVSFVFNVGTGQFLSSTLLRLLNQRDFDGCAKQFDRWHIPPEIASRRNGERAQFEGARFEARIQEAA